MDYGNQLTKISGIFKKGNMSHLSEVTGFQRSNTEVVVKENR
jgi:hypothetical protein